MGTNKRIIITLTIICAMFLSVVGYLTYFTLFRADEIAEHPMNRRSNWVAEEKTLRGSIYDTNGAVLAKSFIDERGVQVREYPFGGLYAHVIGYNSAIYGKSQLEKSYNNLLLGKTEWSSIFHIGGEADVGYDLTLTIDHNIQKVAAQQLGARAGAAVALNPQTGEILAMAGYPTFDPNDDKLTQNWENILAMDNSPFLARATSGLYAPGSTFKIVTSLAILENHLDGQTFDDKGSTTIDGKKFKNYSSRVLGKMDLAGAFAQSSNVAFCEWGAQLTSEALLRAATTVGFGKAVETDIPTAKSQFPQKSMGAADRAAAAIGQWEILATPLQMAKVAAMVANGGYDVPAHLVKKATSQSGLIMYEAKKGTGVRLIGSTESARLKELMVGAVKDGIASGAAISGVSVAGKTGTAETERAGKEHAWFVGFAPADNPTVAVAVIVEYSEGTGSSLAAPIARAIMKAALDK